MSVIMSRPVHDPKYAGAEKETAAGVAVDAAIDGNVRRKLKNTLTDGQSGNSRRRCGEVDCGSVCCGRRKSMPDDAAEFAACVKLPAMAKNIQSAADISAVCGTITAAVG